MKLKNKLIPISSILATTAVVAPIALTSCSQGMVMVDATKPFTPSFSQYDESIIISQYQATQKYVEFAKKNPKSFVEDVTYGMRQVWFDVFDNVSKAPESTFAITNAKITNFSFGINKVSFGESTVCFAGEEPLDYPSVSFDMKVHLECEIDSYDSVEGKDVASLYTLDADVSYSNMIFFAEYVNPLWQLQGGLADSNEVKQVKNPQLGWFISFLDPRSDLIALRNSSNWRITSDSSLTKKETVKISGAKQSETTRTYNNSITLKKAQDFTMLVGSITSGLRSLLAGNAEAWLNIDQAFMPIYASIFNFPTYYFGKVYMTPTITSTSNLTNKERINPGEYQLGFDTEAGPDNTGLVGWQYVVDFSFQESEELSEKYDIGNITLAEDEDLYLPETYCYDPTNRRVLHIANDAVIWDWTWYEEDGNQIGIRIPAEILRANDKETPYGYSKDEMKAWEVSSFDFTFTKRLLKVNIPIYDMTDKSNPKLYMNVVSNVDLRSPGFESPKATINYDMKF